MLHHHVNTLQEISDEGGQILLKEKSQLCHLIQSSSPGPEMKRKQQLASQGGDCQWQNSTLPELGWAGGIQSQGAKQGLGPPGSPHSAYSG